MGRATGDYVRFGGPIISQTRSAIASVAEQDFSEKLLTEAEVGRRLRLSRSALFTLRQTGRIGYCRFGASIRYRVADVAAFIERSRHHGIG